MERTEFDFNVYGSRELKNSGVAGLINSAQSDGISFIARYGEPIVMVLPLSQSGMKKAFNIIEKMMRENEELGDDFRNLTASTFAFLEKYK